MNALAEKVFNENEKLFKQVMNKNNLSKEQAIDDLANFLYNLASPIYISTKSGRKFQVKDINESLHIKLGFYKINSEKELDPEEFMNKCQLIFTEKGEKIHQEYKGMYSN